MKKRLRKKLLLGEFQDWCLLLSLRYDPERTPCEELQDRSIEIIESLGLWSGGGGFIGHESYGVSFPIGLSRCERESLRSRLIEGHRLLQQLMAFEFEIGPLQVDLSKATTNAPRAANGQRQANRRRGVEEFVWDEVSLGCESGCAYCSR